MKIDRLAGEQACPDNTGGSIDLLVRKPVGRRAGPCVGRGFRFNERFSNAQSRLCGDQTEPRGNG